MQIEYLNYKQQRLYQLIDQLPIMTKMKSTLLMILVFGILGLCSAGTRININEHKPHIIRGENAGVDALCSGSKSDEIIGLGYLLQYAYENFINKGLLSHVDYVRYLADVATFFSDDFNFFQLTSIGGEQVSCTNKTCLIQTFERFITNYAALYGSNFLMPYVSTGPSINTCFYTAQTLETGAYILPNTTNVLYLQVLSVQQYTYIKCNGNACAHPWLITRWLSLDYFFEPLNTPIFTNAPALAAFPLPS